VERRINDSEAAIVRRIFNLCANGRGIKAIAKQLNEQRALSPRAQRGRSQTWAPSSVREALFRDLYRGRIAWNRTRKRDQWGQHRQKPRPADDWIDVPAPDLRIVDDALWQAAHARMEAARRLYLKDTGGNLGGRPALGNPSRYLLTNLALCGCCGASLRVRSRKHGQERMFYYGCAGYHERGRTVCSNKADVSMAVADAYLLDALLKDIMDPSIVADAIEEAIALLQNDTTAARIQLLEADLEVVTRERDRLVAAIASGGSLDGLVGALRDREDRRSRLEAERAALRAQTRLRAADVAQARRELTALADDWRGVLLDDPTEARPIVSALLLGRVTITPMAVKCRWLMRGKGR
jgi:hypothetical protein